MNLIPLLSVRRSRSVAASRVSLLLSFIRAQREGGRGREGEREVGEGFAKPRW